MRIKLKYPDVDTFIHKYAVNISRGGIFIATKTPKPVGTHIKFEFQLQAGTSLIRGEGQVQWTREYDPAAPQRAHGMGVRFLRLDPASQSIVDRALKWRVEHGLKKNDSEGITVASTSPAGSTPEPGPLPQPSVALAATEPLGGFDNNEATHVAPRSQHIVEALRADTAARRWAEEARPAAAERPVDDEPTHVGLEHPQPAVDTAPHDTLAAAREGDLRGPGDVTRDVMIPDAPMAAMPARETRPIEIGAAEDSAPLLVAPPTPPPPTLAEAIATIHGRNGHARGDEIDQLAAEWGLSPERIERTARALKKRRLRTFEITSELERLMGKPPKPPTPTKAEAIRLLADLLSRRAASIEELPPAPGAGEPEPSRRKRAG